MSVSLYDLLDVDEQATAAEIRTAWKSAIADLDPTDRRFRAYNDAAGVLLDPERRAAYDAELAASRTDDAPAEPNESAGPDEPAEAAGPNEPTAPPVKLDKPRPATPAPEPDQPADPAPVPAPAAGGPATWVLAVAAFVAALSVALLVVVLSWPGSLGDDAPSQQVERAEKAEAAGALADAAAEAAIPVVLSYDYRTLDADFAEAEKYLSEEFARKRTELFDQQSDTGLTLREQVIEDKVVVTARVSGSGLTRVAPDGKRATVVVYVQQDSQRGKEEPRSLRMWATLSMVAQGDEWVLDDICTEDACD